MSVPNQLFIIKISVFSTDVHFMVALVMNTNAIIATSGQLEDFVRIAYQIMFAEGNSVIKSLTQY